VHQLHFNWYVTNYLPEGCPNTFALTEVPHYYLCEGCLSLVIYRLYICLLASVKVCKLTVTQLHW
jgi:hypothetical protein